MVSVAEANCRLYLITPPILPDKFEDQLAAALDAGDVAAVQLRLKDVSDGILQKTIERLRPVMITVGAAVLALVPLSIRGGPLWEPLCYAQIGGLSVATFIELLLVPVLYGIFVLDLKIIKWEMLHPEATPGTVIPLPETRIGGH